ncbi:MAG: T9SS type A sorting domain-containing protein [Bacteroidales bacterium]|nr:T9SS type A sorting domain-containing protein [Porphyromonas sp.]MDD6934996.1 T9SS type A sorting domain-containing protein [Bacteroidales bacterium]MDY3103011.1 T9SS type A sorting domain-containing protein [Porphyromonas sp.]
MKRHYLLFIAGVVGLGLSMRAQSFHPFSPTMAERTEQIRSGGEIPTVVMFEEDFSNFSKGSEAAPDAENLGGSSSNGYAVKSGYFKTPGWRGSHFVAAGGCALIKEYDYYGSPDWGFFASPLGEYYGEITVTIRARKRAATGALRLVLVENIQGNSVSKDFELTSSWETYTWTTDKAGFENTHTIQFQAINGEIFLDDIKVTRKRNVLPTPIVASLTNLSTSSFQATWKPVSGVDGYLFSCYYKDKVSNKTDTEDFEGIKANNGRIDTSNPNYPLGWTISLTENQAPKNPKEIATADGEYKSGKQALYFDAVGDYILTPKTTEPIKKVSVWIKPTSNMEPSSDEYTLISMSVLHADGHWERIAALSNSMLATDNYQLTFSEDEIGEQIYQIKLDFLQKADPIDFIVDDVSITYPGQKELYTIIDKKRVQDTCFTVENMDPTKEHYFQVWSYQGDLVSKPTSMVWVDGIIGVTPVALEATEVSSNSFRANWTEILNAEKYYVRLYKTHLAKADGEYLPLLEEKFDKITEGSVEAPAQPKEWTPKMETLLAGFTNTDWIVTRPQWAKGMIGVTAKPEWQPTSNQIITPALPIGSAEGLQIEFAVHNTVADTLWVLITDAPEAPSALMGIPFGFPKGEAALHKSKVVFLKDALQHPQYGLKPDKNYYITFMTRDGSAFFLDEVKIAQFAPKTNFKIEELEQVGLAPKSGFLFKDLDAGGAYSYDLTAFRMKNFYPYLSEASNRIAVQLLTASELVQKMLSSVRGLDGAIEIETSMVADLRVYDMQGRLIHTMQCQEGRTKISMNPGMYIVLMDQQAVKVIVR